MTKQKQNNKMNHLNFIYNNINILDNIIIYINLINNIFNMFNIYDLLYLYIIELIILYLYIKLYKIIKIGKFTSTIYYRSLSLPMGYTIKNKLSLFSLLVVSLLSLILTSNIINILDISYELKNNIISVLLIFSILNMCYLKFNIIIRIFNLTLKVIPFYIKNRLKIEYINYISIIYTFLNLFYTFVSLIIIFKINHIIITNFNIDYYDYVNIYSNLLILFISILYIDYIYYNKIEINNNKPHYILLLIILFFISFYGLINYSNLYYIDSLLRQRIDNINYFIDKINYFTYKNYKLVDLYYNMINDNIQSNSNNQSDNNPNPNPNPNPNINTQNNDNNQQQNTDPNNNNTNNNTKNNNTNTQRNVNTQELSNNKNINSDVDEVDNEDRASVFSDDSTSSDDSISSNDTIFTMNEYNWKEYFYHVSRLGHKDNGLNIIKNRITSCFGYEDKSIKNYSFWDQFIYLEGYKEDGLINNFIYKEYIHLLVYEAIKQDNNNNFLLDYLNDLNTFKNKSKNTLIYFNNTYSIWVPEYKKYIDNRYEYGYTIKLNKCWTWQQAIKQLENIINHESGPNLKSLKNIYLKEVEKNNDKFLVVENLFIKNTKKFLLQKINEKVNTNLYKEIYQYMSCNRLYYINNYRVFIFKYKYSLLGEYYTIPCISNCDTKVKLLQLIYDKDRKALIKLINNYFECNKLSKLSLSDMNIKSETLNYSTILYFINDLKFTEFKLNEALKTGDLNTFRKVKIEDLRKIVLTMRESLSFINIVEKNIKSEDREELDFNYNLRSQNENNYLITKNKNEVVFPYTPKREDEYLKYLNSDIINKEEELAKFKDKLSYLKLKHNFICLKYKTLNQNLNLNKIDLKLSTKILNLNNTPLKLIKDK